MSGSGGGQWGQEETRELIFIRGELEKDLSATKQNKSLWEAVSGGMKDRGFSRSPYQCKSKWKNLLNRYKGKETSDPENGCQFPFFEELRALFTERAKNMHRRLLESEGKKRIKRTTADRSSDEDESEEEKACREIPRRRKNKSPRPSCGVQEVVREFFNQQVRMDVQWMEMMERRGHERQLFEQEWQQWMEKVERERLMAEKAWREREEEEERRREESRAERRDSLLTTLLNELINDTNL